MQNPSAIISNLNQLAPALKLILDGIKSLAKGFSYFIYFPIKLAGYSPTPFLAQLIYIAILAWIINKFVKNWTYTLLILVILLVLGLLS